MRCVEILRGKAEKADDGRCTWVDRAYVPSVIEDLLKSLGETLDNGELYEIEISVSAKSLGATRERRMSEMGDGVNALEAKATAKKAVVTAGRLLKKEGAVGEQE